MEGKAEDHAEQYRELISQLKQERDYYERLAHQYEQELQLSKQFRLPFSPVFLYISLLYI